MASCSALCSVVVWVISIVWIPVFPEQGGLACDRAPLYVYGVDKSVGNIRCPPIASPDKAMLMRQLPKQRKITLPGRFAMDNLDDVAGKAIVMHAHLLEL